jgi:VIT1/CCC1 family predicted Fe2+/Mn2+ transporter
VDQPRRSIQDTLILILALTLCASLLIAAFGLVTLALIHPEVDITAASSAVGGLLTSLLGLIIGYLAGRAHGRHNGNGE